jgi:hypothetical protein
MYNTWKRIFTHDGTCGSIPQGVKEHCHPCWEQDVTVISWQNPKVLRNTVSMLRAGTEWGILYYEVNGSYILRSRSCGLCSQGRGWGKSHWHTPPLDAHMTSKESKTPLYLAAHLTSMAGVRPPSYPFEFSGGVRPLPRLTRCELTYIW